MHKNIALDEVFTYDIIAYITGNADAVVITDELVSDLEFVLDDEHKITLYDLDETVNHLPVNDVSGEPIDNGEDVPSVSGGTEIKAVSASMDEAEEGIKITAADGKLTVDLDDKVTVDEEEGTITREYETVKNLRGHWVRVEFSAQIKESIQDEINAGTKTLDDLENVEISQMDDEFVPEGEESRLEPHNGNDPVVSTETHDGVPNTAQYEIKVANESRYSDRSNTVTVKPENPEEPEIEKYVNQAVHKFINLDEVFQYDIIAYITNDADSVVITDELDKQLDFVVDDAHPITISNMGDDDNHKVKNDIHNVQVNGDATVDAVGETIEIKDAVSETHENGTLIVTLDDKVTVDEEAGTITREFDTVKGLRGNWVKVTFFAKIKEGLKIEDLNYTEIPVDVEFIPEGEETRAVPNIGNAPVESNETHEGVPNTASYEISVANAARHEDRSNTVTVKPEKPEEPEIEKYVNQAVHKEIDLEEVFTYDIIAYVTTDAETVTITDVLDSQLQFASSEADVVVVSHDTCNNLPFKDIQGVEIAENADATVATTGAAVTNAEATIDTASQTLTVTIPDATALQGKWVQVTFSAKLADGLTPADLQYTQIDATQVEADRAEPNVGNDPVVSNEAHIGVPNDASYVIGVKNEAGVVQDKYEDKSNTVTVKPKQEFTDVVLVANKVFKYSDEEYITPENGAFTFELKAYDPDGELIKLDESTSYTMRATNGGESGTKAEFALPSLTKSGKYTYEVTEVPGDDAAITYDTTVNKGEFYVAEFILPASSVQMLTTGGQDFVPNLFGSLLNSFGVLSGKGIGSPFAFAIAPATADDTADGTKFVRVLAVVDEDTYNINDGGPLKVDSRDEITEVCLTEVDAGTFTNLKQREEFLSAEASSVTKTWDDGGNSKDRAPVDFQLYKKVGEDGEWELVEGAVVTLTESNAEGNHEWKGSFENLPAYEGTTRIYYRALEANTADFIDLYTADGEEEIIVIDVSSTSGMGATNHPNNPNVEMRISKRAEGSTDELAGAQLQVLDVDGNVAKDASGTELQWTSAKESYAVGQMPVGLYTLREVKAPSGYLVAEDVIFRVNVDGTLEVKDGETWKACDDAVVMYDKPDTEKPKTTTKTTTGESTTAKSTTAKTSDEASQLASILGMLVVLGGAGMLLSGKRVRAQRRK